MSSQANESDSKEIKKEHEFKGILIMFLSVLCVSVGQIFFKLAPLWGISITIAGIVVYFIAFYLTLVAYRFGRMSILFPLSALSFVMTTFVGVFFFSEVLTLRQTVGLAFILLGVLLVSLDGLISFTLPKRRGDIQ
jgi:undecaprenyl phosphate-alpha-L-ara4N flippase subunit ArnE